MKYESGGDYGPLIVIDRSNLTLQKTQAIATFFLATFLNAAIDLTYSHVF